MHLLIDIGNSTVVVAIANQGGDIVDTWRFKTRKDETTSYYRYELQSGIRRYQLQPSDVESVTISSVVPEVNDDVTQTVLYLTGVMPHFFSIADAQNVISIDVESPHQVGKDRIADAVGAVACYGHPVIVFDMGTATTVGIVNEQRCFIGGMIIPGVKTSLNALSSRASQLPTINVEKPQHIIGRNTLECMQSGIVYGTAAMIDGIIDRLTPMFSQTPKVVATGGMAKYIVPNCKHDIAVEEYLQFKGLFSAVVKPQNP